MSKILNVNSGNYKVSVPSGQTITLDTGAGTGNVQITGNITIAGTQTVVNSQELDIVDNIIVLNKGETGAGITENTSGIQLDRGTKSDALLIFDEQTSFNDPVTQTVKAGTFVFKIVCFFYFGLRAPFGVSAATSPVHNFSPFTLFSNAEPF